MASSRSVVEPGFKWTWIPPPPQACPLSAASLFCASHTQCHEHEPGSLGMPYSQQVCSKNVLFALLVIIAHLLLHMLKFETPCFRPVALQTLLVQYLLHHNLVATFMWNRSFSSNIYPFYMRYTVMFSIFKGKKCWSRSQSISLSMNIVVLNPDCTLESPKGTCINYWCPNQLDRNLKEVERGHLCARLLKSTQACRY